MVWRHVSKIGSTSQNNSEVFDEITNMRQDETISSGAFQIRTCNGSGFVNKQVFPGEMCSIRVWLLVRETCCHKE